jgi:predicted dehydrogenase/threonine dehydrogenase-like Zn-dependent dehydrogenase
LKQVVQPAAGGPVRVLDVPRPIIGPTEVLVQTRASVVSAGTERAVTALAQSSLLAKARARPDLVRQVMKKARTEGVASTAHAVKDRLDDDVPLGYSAAGIAVEVGEAVPGVAPGQLVATGGAGNANHAEFQAVPGLLCAVVPQGVPAEDAAFATLASVALHGLRLADVGPGAKVVVIGLGLLGQLAVRLAQASGCDVAGIDVAELQIERARQSGAFGLKEAGEDTTEAILEWSRGRGADAVLVMAATQSSAAMGRTPEICRDRAEVVVVGDVGLDLDRRPFYERELSLQFARSYGPGRYERSYEEWCVDYPPGLIRWTEGRNLEAVLDLLSARRLSVADLVTHRFDIADAADAYRLVEERSEPFMGITFAYPPSPVGDPTVVINPRRTSSQPGVGLIGAGAFARGVLIPALKQAGFDRLVAVGSASGLSARGLAQRAGFEKAVSGPEGVIEDPEVEAVVIATPHDTHATLAAQALRAGKHVFCEKPLALTMDELDDVRSAWSESGRVLFVGFNRRWSEPIRVVRDHFAPGTGPLVITYIVNAGRNPATHWYHDRRQGGRFIGEMSHFIDTCAAIVEQDAMDAFAVGSGTEELLLNDNAVVTLRYGDGSLATISYASGGHVGTEKERLEVLGRGRGAAIIDFRRVVLDGSKVWSGVQEKGHEAQVAAFRRMLVSPSGKNSAGFASMRTTLAASKIMGGLQSSLADEPISQP